MRWMRWEMKGANVLFSVSNSCILYWKVGGCAADTHGLVVLGLQQCNGSFQGDKWGETDTRFLYCATSVLAHLGALDELDHEKTIQWVLRCSNFDGGFGLTEGAESHAAQVFTCVGALSILHALDRIDQDTFCLLYTSPSPRD